MPNSNIGCKTVHSEPCFACLVVDALLNIVCFNGNVRRLVHTPQSLDTLPWLCNLWYWIIWSLIVVEMNDLFLQSFQNITASQRTKHANCYNVYSKKKWNKLGLTDARAKATFGESEKSWLLNRQTERGGRNSVSILFYLLSFLTQKETRARVSNMKNIVGTEHCWDGRY